MKVRINWAARRRDLAEGAVICGCVLAVGALFALLVGAAENVRWCQFVVLGILAALCVFGIGVWLVQDDFEDRT